MKNEEFEKLAKTECLPLATHADGDYKSWETHLVWTGFSARQPEIDALILKNAELEGKILKHQLWESEEIDTLRAEIDTLKSNKVNEIAWHIDVINRENAALRAEVERLRKDAERFGILLREFMYCEVHSSEEIAEGEELIKRYRAMKETK